MPTNNEPPENKQMVVILLGPPGSGKGTQATRICRELKIPHISTGDLFRFNINAETELGKKAKAYMDQGKLVPDELVLEMLFDRVAKEDCRHGYLLDGFPRTIHQAEEFDKAVEDLAALKVIYLEVTDDVVVKRISGRLSCRYCGNVFNLYYNPTKEEGKCDLCGGQLYQRDDDKPEVVQERLSVYKKQTAPLIDYYRKKGILHVIDGEQNPDVIFQNILRALMNNQ